MRFTLKSGVATLDKETRVAEILDELAELDDRLITNPINASANARYVYLKTLLKELTK